jgi:hypothetical protein
MAARKTSQGPLGSKLEAGMGGRVIRFILAPLVWLHDLIASPKFFRRCLLVAAVVYIGLVLWRVMVPEILLHIQTPGASIVLGVIGILATICGLYQYLRDKDEK